MLFHINDTLCISLYCLDVLAYALDLLFKKMHASYSYLVYGYSIHYFYDLLLLLCILINCTGDESVVLNKPCPLLYLEQLMILSEYVLVYSYYNYCIFLCRFWFWYQYHPGGSFGVCLDISREATWATSKLHGVSPVFSSTISLCSDNIYILPSDNCIVILSLDAHDLYNQILKNLY